MSIEAPTGVKTTVRKYEQDSEALFEENQDFVQHILEIVYIKFAS